MSDGSAARRWKPVVAAAAAAMLLAAIGGLATDIGPWYRGLAKPPWQPPDAAFGPAWTFIYACAAVAGVKSWRSAPRRSDRETMLLLFAANAFVNVLWSLLFFRLHRPDWALLDVGVLWSSIVALIVFIGRWSRPGAALLLPYVAWVTFASVLNAAVVDLNAPFGRGP